MDGTHSICFISFIDPDLPKVEGQKEIDLRIFDYIERRWKPPGKTVPPWCPAVSLDNRIWRFSMTVNRYYCRRHTSQHAQPDSQIKIIRRDSEYFLGFTADGTSRTFSRRRPRRREKWEEKTKTEAQTRGIVTIHLLQFRSKSRARGIIAAGLSENQKDPLSSVRRYSVSRLSPRSVFPPVGMMSTF